MEWWFAAIALAISIPFGLLGGLMFRNFREPALFLSRTFVIAFFTIGSVMCIGGGLRDLLAGIPPLPFASTAAAMAFLLTFTWRKRSTPPR